MGHVSKLTLLERLDLVDCEGVEGPGLAHLLVNHPNLVVSSLPRTAVVFCKSAGIMEEGACSRISCTALAASC